jgi:hypothetical protein
MKDSWHPQPPLPALASKASLPALASLLPAFSGRALLASPAHPPGRLLAFFALGAFNVACPLGTAPALQHTAASVSRQSALWQPLLGWFFLKFKYKGKSFRWHRRKLSLVLKFGASHLVALPLPFFVKSRRSGKMKLLLFGSSRFQLRSFASRAIAWRPVNIYNARGLRLARQRVCRKHGKVSAFR